MILPRLAQTYKKTSRLLEFKPRNRLLLSFKRFLYFEIPQERIRNFSIIAHVGKESSTLVFSVCEPQKMK